MLIFPMKKEWYEKIKNGEKTIEYREVKPYWETRFKNEFMNRAGALNCPCILRLGYTKKYMTAQIVGIEIVSGKDTDLNIDKPVYAIHLKLGA
ncbi:hypothetical protein [Treponema denticola]|uniref:hypothetical protein n=1 Tax=Treponema denticola TaxID=158 RepID=UPI0002B5B1FD|nr:hypothetical protein [Treponema denticola]EMB44003.1 hypothetical protein HMPREF9730_01943 [Treponema denticola AL-2]